ncbi:MAG TPA: hypothetical protein VFD32_03760 [Dehalococcoidia bacterium]|nr:hypothetical protein [Dehalococcoidia bacterium]
MAEQQRGAMADATPNDASGMPDDGQGRREQPGRSGVYPASGPLPPDDAPLRTEAEWGQGERDAAGASDAGGSESHP